VEVKAPGKGADPRRYKGHDKEQWEKLQSLPNLLYTDGNSFSLWQNGELVGSIGRPWSLDPSAVARLATSAVQPQPGRVGWSAPGRRAPGGHWNTGFIARAATRSLYCNTANGKG
jgi:hypothetical protein